MGATFKKHDRRHKLLISPVEQYAREHNLFFQKPTNIKTLVPLISSIKPEFMLVCAYGQ